MDTQKPEAVRELITSICQNEGVYLNNELLRIRHYGNTIFAEMTIGVPGDVSVNEGHKMAEKIRLELVGKVKELEDVIIHVDPLDRPCYASSELS
jgi:divalent metal cation (Fe/Co/Zn/Cd) transporter